MKKFLLFLSIVVLFIIQTALGEKLEIFDVSPSLLLTFVIVYSFNSPVLKSAVVGLVCGLLTDTVGLWILGYNALVMMYAGVFTSLLSSRKYFQTNFLSFITVFAFTFIFRFFSVVISNLMTSDLPIWYITYRYILIECVYNSCISLLFLPFIKRLKIEYVRGI